MPPRLCASLGGGMPADPLMDAQARVALNATKAAVEEGIVPGGGTTLALPIVSAERSRRRNLFPSACVGSYRTCLGTPEPRAHVLETGD